MVPSRNAQKAARRGDGSPSPTGPRERDTKGANDAKQRRKIEPADLDAARRESEKAMRRLSTQDDDNLPPPAAAARPAPAAVAATASSNWSPDRQITTLVRDASQRGRDAAKARKPKDVDQALQDTTAALRGSDFMHKFSGESDALLEAFLESGPAPIPQQDA